MTGWKLTLLRRIIPHYLIIGYHTKKPIGCTYGRVGKREVRAEEPNATFKRIPLRKCPICQKVRFENVHKS